MTKRGSILRDEGTVVPCTGMSKRPSDKPPEPPSDKPPEEHAEETVATSAPKPDRERTEFFPFGLSADQFAKVTREMLVVARLVCRHVTPGDAVQQAFVKALSKPITERPSIQDQKKFIAWMCTLAEYEALTNRNYQRRRAQREVVSGTDIAEMVVVPPSVSAVEARKMLERAFMALKPADQAFLQALYAQGKTIDDLAREQGQRWSTVDSRHRRLLDLLYAMIHGAIAVALLLVPKRARAFVAHVMQQTPRRLVQASQFGSAMAVTVVCGVFMPTGSSATTELSMPVGLTRFSTPQTTIAQAAPLQPSFLPEVGPEEPKTLDAVTNQCSAADMKSAKIASYLQGTVAPLAFWGASALTQVACAGSEQQTPPPRQPVGAPTEEPDGSHDPYAFSCKMERMRGNECPSREEWEKIGLPR
jgi:DNA-directed RNA polymerase specialized sigma24 family protein